jgi:hypothetical protein
VEDPEARNMNGTQAMGQPIDQTQAYGFLQNVLTTEEEELDCEEVMAVIARYVEVEIANGNPRDVSAGVPLHLSHCPHCAEMYETLKVLASLEADGELPAMDALWTDLQAAVDGGQSGAPAAPELAEEPLVASRGGGISSIISRFQQFLTPP